MVSYTYRASVVRVVDGDTVDLLVDTGFYQKIQIRCRLKGVNAPEMWHELQEERDKAKAATEWMKDKIPVGTEVVVRTSRLPGDRYGRWIGEIFVDLENLSEAIVKAGHAKLYMP
jgi:micrococcal nuclease